MSENQKQKTDVAGTKCRVCKERAARPGLMTCERCKDSSGIDGADTPGGLQLCANAKCNRLAAKDRVRCQVHLDEDAARARARRDP